MNPSPEQIDRYATDFVAFCEDAMIPTSLGAVRFGDVMHAKQRKLIADIGPSLIAIANGQMPPKPKFWAEMVKSWGKDLIVGMSIIWLLVFARRPIRAQLGAADQDQAGETHRSIKGVVLCWTWLASLIETPNNRVVCESTESDAEVLAADVAGSHGAVGVDLLILNELHAVQKWTFIENLADNSSKNQACVTIVCTNAGFKSHPAWKWRELARTSPRWAFHQVCEPPPWVDPVEIEEAARRNSNERYRRLWWGVWSSGAGDALDEADILAAIDTRLPPLSGPIPGTSFIGGLDLGWKHDHSALCVLGADHATQRIRLAHCESWAPTGDAREVDLEAVSQAVLSAYRRFGLCRVVFDGHQAALMAQQLTRQGVVMSEMRFAGANLTLMATTLLDVFRSRRIDIYPAATKLAADLRRLTIVEKEHDIGNLEATRDASGHADTAIALALCLPQAVSLASSPYGPGSVMNLPVDPRSASFQPHRPADPVRSMWPSRYP